MHRPPLLMLAQRLPFPPDKGEKIRSYHLLRHLAERHAVHLGTCIDDPADEAHIDTVRTMVASLHVTRLSRRRALATAALRWPLGDALSFGYFHDPAFDRWVQSTLAVHQPRIAIGYSSNILPPLLRSGFRPGKIIADFVDVDSQKWNDYADRMRGPRRWLYRSEARRTHAAEARIGAASDAILFVSEDEASLFRSLHPQLAGKTGHYANGVDLEAFRPGIGAGKPDGIGDAGIVFTGRMDYWPNVDAVNWFARHIWPAVRHHHPEARFCIVGAAPSAEVMALAALPGIMVTGRVPQVQGWLDHAALAVAPMRVGRGIQNKVLEAMAMGKAMVVSPDALTGINAGSEVVTATDAESWQRECIALIGDAARRQQLGMAARAFVESRFSWSAQLKRLDALLD